MTAVKRKRAAVEERPDSRAYETRRAELIKNRAEAPKPWLARSAAWEKERALDLADRTNAEISKLIIKGEIPRSDSHSQTLEDFVIATVKGPNDPILVHNSRNGTVSVDRKAYDISANPHDGIMSSRMILPQIGAQKWREKLALEHRIAGIDLGLRRLRPIPPVALDERKTCGLLSLPVELRNQIYDYILPAANICIWRSLPKKNLTRWQQLDGTWHPQSNSTWQSEVALLYTCRGIYHEASTMFLGKATIHYRHQRHSLETVLARRSLKHRSAVRSIVRDECDSYDTCAGCDLGSKAKVFVFLRREYDVLLQLCPALPREGLQAFYTQKEDYRQVARRAHLRPVITQDDEELELMSLRQKSMRSRRELVVYPAGE